MRSSLATEARASLSRRVQRARLLPISRQVIDERLTYLQMSKMRTLQQCARQIKRKRVVGDVIECGIALGGSAIMLARTCSDRDFHGYDVFGMIPPPTENDPPEVHDRYATIVSGASQGLGGDTYYGYRTDLYDEVTASFARHGMPVGDRVHLHSGLFEDTLHPSKPVALAHIDCDWHDPVKLCLERIWPWLPVGGLLVFDDYNDYGGCTRAVDGFVAATPDARMTQQVPNAVVARVGAPGT